MLQDQPLEFVHAHAIGVDRGTDQMGAIQPETLNGGQKGRRLDNHLVARGDHGLSDQVQRLLAAGGDNQALRCDPGAFGRHKIANGLAQRLVTFGRAVLQHRPRIGRQHGIRCNAHTFGVKQRRVRKTAGETDDAGFAQQLEQFPDGRCLDVAQAVSEYHGGCS